MATFVLDTSAVSAFVNDEAGADVVERLLERARDDANTRVLMPFVVPTEIEYKLLRALPAEDVDDQMARIESWPVQEVNSDYAWRRASAWVKASFKLSFADAWVAALALINDAELIHKDPEFDAIPQLKHLRLPYTPPTSGVPRS